MSARDDFPSDHDFDYDAAMDEIDRLRSWQSETITWLAKNKLLLEINGGELVPCDEIYTPEGVDIIRRQQHAGVPLESLVALWRVVRDLPVRVVTVAADPIEIAKCKGHNALRDELQAVR